MRLFTRTWSTRSHPYICTRAFVDVRQWATVLIHACLRSVAPLRPCISAELSEALCSPHICGLECASTPHSAAFPYHWSACVAQKALQHACTLEIVDEPTLVSCTQTRWVDRGKHESFPNAPSPAAFRGHITISEIWCNLLDGASCQTGA